MKLDRLFLEDLEDGTFRIVKDFAYQTQVAGGETIIVPAGAETDLASIPAFARSIVSTTGKYNKAAVVHDWLYRTQGMNGRFTQLESDKIMSEAMIKLGVDNFTRNKILLGLRSAYVLHLNRW